MTRHENPRRASRMRVSPPTVAATAPAPVIDTNIVTVRPAAAAAIGWSNFGLRIRGRQTATVAATAASSDAPAPTPVLTAGVETTVAAAPAVAEATAQAVTARGRSVLIHRTMLTGLIGEADWTTVPTSE